GRFRCAQLILFGAGKGHDFYFATADSLCFLHNYRCPLCNAQHSVSADRIFDGRLIFKCSKCKSCAIVQAASNTDEAYLEFLDKCESKTGIASSDDMQLLMEQEKILRPKAEIDKLISDAGVGDDALINSVLRSRSDYVVDFTRIVEPPP